MTRRALVCALMPEHDRDSGSRRVLHLIDGLLSDGWAVTFVSQHANAKPRYVRAMQQRGIDVYPGAPAWMDQLIATRSYDLIALGLWDIAEPYIARIRTRSPHTRIIVDSIDLHFLRHARKTFQNSAARTSVGVLDARFGSEAARELNTYAAADAVLTVSQKEADLINDLTTDPLLAVSVADGEDIPESPVPLAQRRGMVYVGCYRFPPNVRAVEYLCREILPLVDPRLLEQHPVYIVGDGLDDTVRGFGAGMSNVHMVGWVPSVEPYLNRARISVVPLLFGAGTKRKILQTLMYGTPAVSTSIGIEGFNLVDGRHVVVADDAEAFADGIGRLLTDDGLWERIKSEGRAHITAAHGREVIRKRLLDVVASVLSRPPKPAPPIPVVPSPAASLSPEGYQQLVGRIRAIVDADLPADAGVIVVSKGDEALVKLGSRSAGHFPQTADGRYAGHYPADAAQAITQLNYLHDDGLHYLLFPVTAFWWLDHYQGLKEHLEERYDLLVDESDTCRIYGWRDRGKAVAALPMVTSSYENEPNDVLDDVDTRLIAFLLPQFHPIPENDRWWGKGFTEWTNVTNARPLFADHYQPRLPADLGFYDLRLPDVRAAQAALAQQYGIHGFCYYHFWFGGKLLLERPFDEVLRTGEPDFPFCVCWANEPWSRRWDGRERDVLQPQAYSHEDDIAHIRWLMPALADPRAITIDGRPLFIVYQSKELPEPGRTTDTWREEVLKAGLPGVYLLGIETGWDAGWDATSVGFDGKVLFAPQFATLFGSGTQIEVGGPERLRVFDYQRAWKALVDPAPVSYKRYETVCPSWDNTARSGERGVVLHNSSPDAYQRWLERAIARAATAPVDERIVFINAWNEWAEGCHLEPDRKFGRAYLDATKRALASAARRTARARQGTAVAAGVGV